MIEGTYQWRSDRIPVWGKDHLVLADWRLSTPRRKWRRGAKGAETGVFEYEFERPGNRTQLVTMESGAETPFPALNDDQFLIGLMTLSGMAGCPEILRFEPSHLLQVIRRADCQNNIKRAQEALKCYKAMSTHFEGLWFDRKAAQGELSFSSGVLADFGFASGRGRRKAGTQRASYIQWTKSFYESMRNGNLININLDDLAACSARTGALQLLRMTNKAWHGGRKPSVYERDLKELACGHLRMKNDKWTKRNFQNIVEWMEKQEYFKALDKHERYVKIAHGIWRVRLEIHPSRITEQANKTLLLAAGKSRGKAPTDDAAILVQSYMQARFNRTDYRPTHKDRERAKGLLKQASLSELLELIPSVVLAIRAKNAGDLYFGFAEPVFVQALEARAQRSRSTEKRKEVLQSSRRHDAEAESTLQVRKARRSQLLAVWSQATAIVKQRCVSQAVDLAETRADVDRILDSPLDSPAPEVLNQLELSLNWKTCPAA